MPRTAFSTMAAALFPALFPALLLALFLAMSQAVSVALAAEESHQDLSEDLPRDQALSLAKADLRRVQTVLWAHPDSLPALHDKLRLLHALSLEDKALVDSGKALLQGLRGRAPSSALAPVLSPALRQAYGGALDVVLAKHALWPGTKMDYLDSGLPALDSAVAADPDNAEIRYLRLVSCYFLPFFLGRKASVREDFTALARLLPGFAGLCPPRWYLGISGFVLKNGKLSPPQKERLSQARQSVLARLRGNSYVSGNLKDSG